MTWLYTFDQTTLQLQLPPQSAFFASHLAIIALVIETCQMQDAVQRQYFHLVRNGMPQAPSVLSRDVGGNCHVSGNTFCPSTRRQRRGK
jgi:hypothetical protein